MSAEKDDTNAGVIARLEALLAAESKMLSGFGSAHSLSQRRHREARYAQAYQQLVRAGARPKLRGKYRG